MHVTARALTILEGSYFLSNSRRSTAQKYTRKGTKKLAVKAAAEVFYYAKH